MQELPNPVFRVKRANPLAALFLGALLGCMFAGVLAVLLLQDSTNPYLEKLVIAIGLAAGIGLAQRLERRGRHDSCSSPDCQVELPAEAETCPRCGGPIVRR